MFNLAIGYMNHYTNQLPVLSEQMRMKKKYISQPKDARTISSITSSSSFCRSLKDPNKVNIKYVNIKKRFQSSSISFYEKEKAPKNQEVQERAILVFI